jgi:peptidoglycan/LPS O-acetylase OafA/YrhL
MVVYLTLLVTAAFTPFKRCITLLAVTAYCIYCDIDVLLNLPFFAGALLADLSLVVGDNSHTSALTPNIKTYRPGHLLRSCLRTYWPICLAIVGLFIGSYPPGSPELSAWSWFLYQSGNPFLPSYCNYSIRQITADEIGEYEWAYTLIGTVVFIFAIQFSSFLRQLLSSRIAVFLGSISFPMYLLHSFLMRSVLVWVIYGVIPDSGGLVRRPMDFGEYPVEKSAFWTIVTGVSMLAWFGLLVYVSVLWRDQLDGSFVALAKWSEEVMLGKASVLASIIGTIPDEKKSEYVSEC